ncbi:lytic transglycosylase [Thalassolituus pacificus]|uniref:LysM peptidoglycan-binding domain-containing protein n=1 Tax=Thalassolituus pacificus TaxID=2975440 RepID=A0A9X3AH13_9GAMM|nr:LysM peptidoglycan-binding domain-containing protein [Thalassolituus pacificus]MCT7359642.1 LysM peptidoglycan-binding domain-containing protein [Thalassolituus pacificus]
MQQFTLLLSALFMAGCSQLATKADSEPEQKRSDMVLTVIEDWQPQDVSHTTYEDIWQRIIASYQLDTNIDNPRIAAQLNWFKSHQSYMDRVAERGVRYLHFIAEQIEARNVPGELALLPIVESAFDPFAYSHGRASGVWQFIPSTGRDFGLQQDWWHDGRRDIRAATEAALMYLDALQREFNGDWLLALAAYNSGAGTVRKAMRKNRARGLATDFWSLDLPKETRDYVPKLIALAKLVKSAEEYQITLLPVPDEPYFAVAETGGQIDLSQVAELSQTPLDEIYKLNPGFNRWATRPSGPHEVLIPVAQYDVFTEQLASLPASARLKWQRYAVRNGDSLITIAKQFHTTPDALKQANGIRGNIIRAGEQLLIPGAFKSQDSYSHSVSQRLDRLKTLRRPGNSERVEYRVRSGDSFWEIARSHDVKVSDLARWNGMAPGDPLRAGQSLVIWSKKNMPGKREVIRKVNYRVRSGDSLARISQKFNVRISDVKRWNSSQVKEKYLQPGQTLTLYVDVMR